MKDKYIHARPIIMLLYFGQGMFLLVASLLFTNVRQDAMFALGAFWIISSERADLFVRHRRCRSFHISDGHFGSVSVFGADTLQHNADESEAASHYNDSAGALRGSGRAAESARCGKLYKCDPVCKPCRRSHLCRMGKLKPHLAHLEQQAFVGGV